MNKLTLNKPIMKLSAAAVMATFVLAGCSKTDPASVDAGAQSERSAVVVGTDAPSVAGQVSEASREVVQDVKEAGKSAATEVSDKVSDAVITSSVKAELVKDPKLSALKINVDTDAGRVLLKGSAPSSSARDQAVRIAQAVKGVVSVDNQLVVEAGKG